VNGPGDDPGQASVELVGGALGLLLAGLVAFQLLAAGYGVVMADHAAEAAALALANERSAADAARGAVPGWPRTRVRVRTRGDHVFVTLVPPSPLRLLGDRLSTTGAAAVRLPGDRPAP
jgi:hypothetical protein